MSGKRRLAEALFASELHQMVDHLDDLLGPAREASRSEEPAVDDECRYPAHVVGLQELARLRDLRRDSRGAIGLSEFPTVDAVARGPADHDFLVVELYVFEVKLVV